MVFLGGRRSGSEMESGIKSEMNTAEIVVPTDAGTRRGAVK